MHLFAAVSWCWVAVIAPAQEFFTQRLGGNFVQLGHPPMVAGAVAPSPSAEVLRRLFEGDETDALDHAIAHLRGFIDAFLAISPDERQAFDQQRSFVQFVRAYGLQDRLLQRLQSQAPADPEDRLAAAALADMLGESAIALSRYAAVLEADPSLDGARARLIWLAIEEEGVPAAVAAMDGLSTKALLPMGATLRSRIQMTPEQEYERRLDYFEVLAAYFNRLDPATYVAADWLGSLIDNYLGQANWSETLRFPDLYTTGNYSMGYNSPAIEKRSQEVEARRAKVHADLCRALLRMPQFAEEGFRRLSGLAMRREEGLTELESEARRILLEMPAAPKRPESETGSVPPVMPYREDWVPFLSPAEFLVQRAIERGEVEALDGKLLKPLVAAGNEDAAALVREIISLSLLEGEAFVTRVAALMRRGIGGITPTQLMVRALAMRGEEQEVDLGPAILAYLEATRDHPYQSPSFVYEYGNHQLAEGQERFRAFIEDAAVAMLGPKEGQAALVAANPNPNASSTSSAANRVPNFTAFLGQMMQSTASIAAPLKKAFALGLVHPANYQLPNRVQNSLRYYRFANESEALMLFLTEMGLLGDLETIEFYPMNNISRGTLFGLVYYNLCRVDSDEKERVMDVIAAYPEDTFGKAMLLSAAEASSSSSSQRTTLTKALEPFVEKITALPEAKQDEFRYWYSQAVSNNTLPSSLEREAPKVAAWYSPWRNSEAAGKLRARFQGNAHGITLEAFLNTPHRATFDVQNGLDYAAQQALQGMRRDGSNADYVRIVDHYVELAKQPMPSQGMQPYVNATPLIQQWLASHRALEALGATMALMDRHEISLDAQIAMWVTNALNGESFSDPAETAKRLLAASEGAAVEAFTPFFAERFANLTPAVRGRVFAWAKEASGSALGASWQHAAGLAQGETTAIAWWKAYFTDPDRTFPERLQAAQRVAPMASRGQAWAVVEAIIVCLDGAWKAEEPVVVPGEVPSGLLQPLLAAGEGDKEAVRLTSLLLEKWAPHFGQTPIGLPLVQQVLALGKGYEIDAGAWVSALPQTVQRQPGFLVMLLKGGHVEQARAAVPWTLVSMPPVNDSSNRRSRSTRQPVSAPSLGTAAMDEPLHAALQRFLPTVEDPGQRYFVELSVLALMDGPNLRGVAKREERLAALRDRFTRDAFSSAFLAEHTVSWLCALTEINEQVRPSVAHFGDQIDFQALANWQDPVLKSSRQGLLNHYLNDAAENFPEAFARLLMGMLATANRHNGEAQRLLDTYCREFPSNLLKTDELLTPEQAKPYLPLLRELSSMARELYWSSRDDCVRGTLILHVLANEVDSYREWMKALPINVRRQLIQESSLDNVAYTLRDGLKNDDLSPQRRLEVIDGLFAASAPIPEPENSGYRQGTDSNAFERLVDLSLVKKEELMTHGPRWARLNPRNGAAFAELGGLQEEAGETDQAVVNYVQAVAHVPRYDSSSYSRYHYQNAQLLVRLGRVDAAQSWMDFLDRGRIDGGMAEAYEVLERDIAIQFLTDPTRVTEMLREIRLALAMDERDFDRWRQLADLLAAEGQKRVGESDYLGGLAFLRVSFFVLHQIRAADPRFDKDQYDEVKRRLAEGLRALGLGGEEEPLIAKGSRWLYHYRHGGVKGSAWRELDFADVDEWEEGPAPLGYAEGDEQTTLYYGEDPDNKPITGYFRTTFEVADPSRFDELSLGVRHDDGMVVYLNGRQLARNNLPQGVPITPTTLAPNSRGEERERNYWRSVFKSARLVPGLNVIAVEVHQNAPDSSDFGFDLEILAAPVNAREVVAEVSAGKPLRWLRDWTNRLPAGFIETLNGLAGAELP